MGGLAVLAAPAPNADAAPAPSPYGHNDYGGFRNILPPAQGRSANLAQVAAFQANGTYPPHTSDQQLSMYTGLMYATPGLEATEIRTFYKDATFGTKHPGNIEGTYSPRGDVTIQSVVRGGEFEGALVDYRMREKNGQWLVIDVIVEGISLVSNFRDQFKEVLARGGPDELLKKLREKNAAGPDPSFDKDKAS